MKPPRLLIVADVGGPDHYHLGDEAMLEANLGMFRQLVPGIQFTVLTRDPAWTSNRYGVRALRTPGFHLGDDIIVCLRDADGLVVSGGGNLCRTWPEKIRERVALIEQARELGCPVAVLGQTLGPELTVDDRRLLTAALPWSQWVGVRDEPSATLALSLGVPPERVHRQFDDAYLLEPLAVEGQRSEGLGRSERRWIMVTLDASFGSVERERALRVMASQLDALADCLDAALVFVPHVGGSNVPAALDDCGLGRTLSAHLRSPMRILDLWQPREVRWLAAQAAMVVSSRYHPLVFATAAGVASLGVYTDSYTRTKLRGALAATGLEGWCLSVEDAERGRFLPLAMELWHQREPIERHLARVRVESWPRELRRFSEICRALRLEPVGTPVMPRPDERWPTRNAVPSFIAGNGSLPDLIRDEQWNQYEEQGYLRLGRVLDEPQLAALCRRMDQIMLGQVRYPTLQMQLDTGGAYEDLPDPVAGLPEATLAYRKVQGLETDPLVLDLIRRDLFREICARHYGRHASISIFRAMLMNKPSGKGTYLPWHQDAGDVWKLDRDPVVTLWIALDPATRANGCVQVIPGSHRLGLLSKNGSTVSPDHARIYCPDEAAVFLEVEPGEAILLHNWLLHRSDVNRTGTPRRALTFCYMDGRTLSTLTGNRFPIVFGEHEEAEIALSFLRSIKEENEQLRDTAAEAQRYAKSLVEDNQRRERHARSLEAELAVLRSLLASSTASF